MKYYPPKQAGHMQIDFWGSRELFTNTYHYIIPVQSGAHSSLQDSNSFSEDLFIMVSSGDHEGKQTSVIPPALTQPTEQQTNCLLCVWIFSRKSSHFTCGDPKCAGSVWERCTHYLFLFIDGTEGTILLDN